MNKYYTPEISDFHVGFEYEVFQKSQDYDINILYLMEPEREDIWYKFKYPDPFLGYNLEKLFEKCTLRVKYLDKESIIELGYEETANNVFADNEYEIELLDNNVVVIDRYHINPERLFKGVIKNKSKFKEIMKCLTTS